MSRSPENILLRLPRTEEQAIDALFDELESLGFPRQHQTPHISLTFSQSMDPRVTQLAHELLPPLIPSTLRRVGTVVFGTKRKQTVAWLLEADEALEQAARRLSAANPEGRGDRWTPHLTMGLRLSRDIVPDYLRALDHLSSRAPRTITADRALYWQPRLQRATVLAGG